MPPSCGQFIIPPPGLANSLRVAPIIFRLVDDILVAGANRLGRVRNFRLVISIAVINSRTGHLGARGEAVGFRTPPVRGPGIVIRCRP